MAFYTPKPNAAKPGQPAGNSNSMQKPQGALDKKLAEPDRLPLSDSAKELKKKGRYMEAADAYLAIGMKTEAADSCKEGKFYDRAAEIYISIGETGKAKECALAYGKLGGIGLYAAAVIYKNLGIEAEARNCVREFTKSQPGLKYENICSALGIQPG